MPIPTMATLMGDRLPSDWLERKAHHGGVLFQPLRVDDQLQLHSDAQLARVVLGQAALDAKRAGQLDVTDSIRGKGRRRLSASIRCLRHEALDRPCPQAATS